MPQETSTSPEVSDNTLSKDQKKELKKEFIATVKQESKKVEKQVEHVIQHKKSFSEKLDDFFHSIDFLALDDEAKTEVALKVKTQSVPDRVYWLEIFLSSMIATLGLLQNSVAVIIGAMLIAPLLRPINGLGFTIARGGDKFFKVAFMCLLFSIILSIFVGYIATLILGWTQETPEIIARVSPNIIDFFIAIFSAVVAVMSLRFLRLGESVAGVAMAASLMPPLAVVGIELALNNYSQAGGAFMLFASNLIAIIAVGVLFFWLYGFTPHDDTLQKNSLKRMGIVSLLTIIILIPLTLSFMNIKENHILQTQVKDITQYTLISTIPDAHTQEAIIIQNTSHQITIKAIIIIPEDVTIELIGEKIQQKLEQKLEKRVHLELEIRRGMIIGE